ncbi:MAG: GtrA family protein [Hahellaceae bacterium]|nr:GtrA family protein [Hahellaceae bacterium]
MSAERQPQEIKRYIVNGLVATAVHYAVLHFNIEVVGIKSAGLANLLAAVVGITTSFLGSRYYVFRHTEGSIWTQAARFSGLYATLAVLHGLTLLVWTDWLGLSYTGGFLLATGFQVSLSYLGNKYLVFSK